MPTARELLEQADALMRRNRQQVAREVAPPPDAPLPSEPHPAASPIDAALPSEAHPAASPIDATLPSEPQLAAPPPDASLPSEPLPVAPPFEPDPQIVDPLPATRSGVSAEAAPPGVEDPGETATGVADDADIPLLEDEVGAADDDVPLLTDAIDEIEVGAPAIDEGDPSDWLVESTGEQSVLGPSPPSVARVPAVVPDGPSIVAPVDPTSDASARIDPLAGLEDFHPEPTDPDVTLRRPEPAVAAWDADERPPRQAFDDRMSPRGNFVAGNGVPVPGPPETPIDVAARSLDTATTAPADDESGIRAESDANTDALSPPPPPEPEIAALSQALPPVLPIGAEREALAEEIRMQVLQRIDMFTDTGLRERLGERLKPIVDRASADLVDAINQHVGEILRAYVAEAIEREIDRWRAGR